MADDYHMKGGRRERNLQSKEWAHRDGQPWTAEDDDVLVTYWVYVDAPERDETGISQLLERTIESCRVRCEKLRKELGLERQVVRRTRTTTETVEYIGAFDDPDDVWWK